MPEPDTHRFSLPKDPDQITRLAELGQLASGLSHEIRNPLGVVKLNVDMLIQQLADPGVAIDREKTLRRLKRARSAASQLEDLVNSFLGYARPGRPDRDRSDCNKILDAILHEESEAFEQAQIQVNYAPAQDLFAMPGDSRMLTSIFRNIILNARDALLERPDNRRLVIATRNRHGAIRVVIANNGPPLAESIAAHLFQPFHSTKDQGTGLGLAIVGRLVELHGGKVTAMSDPQQGVSFTIEFPTSLGPAKALSELPLPNASVDL